MIKKLEHRNMGRSQLQWLNSTFHFSFAEYYNPRNISFGVLRVLNDDYVQPNTGFDTHSHSNMEVISYVVNGQLTHGDSMGNKNTITRGRVQYMSAGTGVSHSEHNFGQDILRFLQIWVFPDKENYAPHYGDYRFEWEDRKNKWLHIVSSKTGDAPIKINQDVNFYVLELDKEKEISFPVKEDRQAYLVQIEGTSKINDYILDSKDAMEIVEENIRIFGIETSHFIIIEMGKVLA